MQDVLSDVHVHVFVFSFKFDFYFNSGEWLSPQTTGIRPLPCAGFSFTKVDPKRAVLFGGRQRHDRVNEINILDMESWVWFEKCTQPMHTN